MPIANLRSENVQKGMGRHPPFPSYHIALSIVTYSFESFRPVGKANVRDEASKLPAITFLYNFFPFIQTPISCSMLENIVFRFKVEYSLKRYADIGQKMLR